MNRLLIIASITLFCIEVVAGYFYLKATRNKPKREDVNYDQLTDTVAVDCANKSPFDNKKNENDSYVKIFSVFSGDITYNTNRGVFESPSNKRFGSKSIDVTEVRIAKQLIVVPRFGSQKYFCLIAIVVDEPGLGRAAYETTSGEIKLLQIKNLPPP